MAIVKVQAFRSHGFPSLPRQAINLSQALVRVGQAVATGQPVRVSAEQLEARLKICLGDGETPPCPHLRAVDRRCSLQGCGCFVELKAKLATESCPANPPRW